MLEAPTRRPHDSEATRQAILDAAEALFAEHGFSACALREVAARAGVTRSLIHHHFGAKQGLWHAVVERRFQEYAEIQWDILSLQDLDLSGFEESIHALFRFLERHPSFVHFHAWANAGDGGEETYGATKSALTERGVARLRELQRKGGIRPDLDPASILASFFALIEHWFQARRMLQARFGHGLPEDSTYLATLASVLIRGIRA